MALAVPASTLLASVLVGHKGSAAPDHNLSPCPFSTLPSALGTGGTTSWHLICLTACLLLSGTDATHAEHIETIKTRMYVGLTDDQRFLPGHLGMGLVEGKGSIH